jgi:hypothetical protein
VNTVQSEERGGGGNQGKEKGGGEINSEDYIDPFSKQKTSAKGRKDERREENIIHYIYN